MKLKKVTLVVLVLIVFLCMGAVSAMDNITNEEIIKENNLNELESSVDITSDGEKTFLNDESEDMASEMENDENNALKSSTEDILQESETPTQFKHEAFTILSPLKNGIYTVNKTMDLSVKIEKWIYTYTENGFMVMDNSYVVLQIIKDGNLEKTMSISIYPPGTAFSSVGMTDTDTFTPTELGDYTVVVGFVTGDVDRENNFQLENKINELNYVDNYTFHVVEKKDNPNEQTNTNQNTNAGKSSTTKTTKTTPKIIAKSKTFKKSVKTKKYSVTLKDKNNKAVKKVKLTLKIKGKTYKAITNSKGKATFKIKNLKKKGTFKATITYKGNSNYKKVTKKVTIKCK